MSKQQDRSDRLLDRVELAERLGVQDRFIKRLIAEKRIAYLTIGKYVRFHPHDVDEYIERQRVAAQS